MSVAVIKNKRALTDPLTIEHCMETNKMKLWIRIIALWALFTSFVTIAFYFLIKIGTINETLTSFDLFEILFDVIAGLVIFTGLWRFTPWGWKTTVLLLPLSWIFATYILMIDYERGYGVITSPFIIIDALILRYLFKPGVREFCKISSTFLLRLQWSANVLFLLALFLIVYDIFGGLFGLSTVLAIFLGVMTAKRYKRKREVSQGVGVTK